MVKTGDSLFEIAPDPTPQELLNVDHRVRSSEASFLKAKADYERGRELHEEGLMSKGDLDALNEIYALADISRQQAADNQRPDFYIPIHDQFLTSRRRAIGDPHRISQHEISDTRQGYRY